MMGSLKGSRGTGGEGFAGGGNFICRMGRSMEELEIRG